MSHDSCASMNRLAVKPDRGLFPLLLTLVSGCLKCCLTYMFCSFPPAQTVLLATGTIFASAKLLTQADWAGPDPV
eukprot:400773-Pelagomonas_calceolata.AAC.1